MVERSNMRYISTVSFLKYFLNFTPPVFVRNVYPFNNDTSPSHINNMTKPFPFVLLSLLQVQCGGGCSKEYAV